jgi:hypothetical protein
MVAWEQMESSQVERGEERERKSEREREREREREGERVRISMYLLFVAVEQSNIFSVQRKSVRERKVRDVLSCHINMVILHRRTFEHRRSNCKSGRGRYRALKSRHSRR